MKLDKEQQIESTVNREKRNNWGTINTFENDESIEKIKKCKNCQGCILSPCLFNFYAEYIMRNAGLEEAQAGIKIAGININNLRYAMTPPLWQKVEKN